MSTDRTEALEAMESPTSGMSVNSITEVVFLRRSITVTRLRQEHQRCGLVAALSRDATDHCKASSRLFVRAHPSASPPYCSRLGILWPPTEVQVVYREKAQSRSALNLC